MQPKERDSSRRPAVSVRPDDSQSMDFLRRVIDVLPDGVIVADAEGAFLLFNAAAERILGRGLEQIDVSRWSAVYGCFLPDGTTLFRSEELPLARALQGEVVRDVEILIRNPHARDGVQIVANAFPLENAAGKLDGGVVMFRDVTEIRRTTETSRRLASAVEQTADGVLIADHTGKIVFVNPAFEQLSGYSRDEILGRDTSLLRSGEHSTEFYRDLWSKILDGKVFRATMANRRKDGSRYWCEQTITPMTEHDGAITHFVAVLKDMTEHRALQEHSFQMRLARAVQQRFYGVEIDIAGYDIAGRAFPVAQTGGDYYDFIPFPDGGLGVAIGDITGHGFGSALLMAELRTALQIFSRQHQDVAEIMNRVNEMLYEDLSEGRLATLLFLRLDPRSGSFSFASAGHCPGYVVHPTDGVQCELAATGLPLGVFKNSKYTASGPHTLAAGNLLLLSTDGLTEMAHGSEGRDFGVNGVLQVLHASHRFPADEIIASLYAKACEHAQGRPQQDDVTLIVCKALA